MIKRPSIARLRALKKKVRAIDKKYMADKKRMILEKERKSRAYLKARSKN